MRYDKLSYPDLTWALALPGLRSVSFTKAGSDEKHKV